MQDPSSKDKYQALTFIARQIETHQKIAAGILCASILSTVIFFCYIIGKDHIPLLSSTGMLVLLISSWIINSHHAEMANRYQSVFEKIAKQKNPHISLYVKRPITENVSAMWNRAETVFYIGIIVVVTFVTYGL